MVVLSGERIPFLVSGSGPSGGQGSGSKGRGMCQLIPPLPGRPRQPERSGRICKDKHRPLVALATGHAPPRLAQGRPAFAPLPSPLCLSAQGQSGFMVSLLQHRGPKVSGSVPRRAEDSQEACCSADSQAPGPRALNLQVWSRGQKSVFLTQAGGSGNPWGEDLSLDSSLLWAVGR